MNYLLIAALQAPVKFSLGTLGGKEAGKKGGSVCINALNRWFFSTTAGLVFTWRVMLDGKPLSVGEPLQLDPDMWHPGGSVLIQPQVVKQNLPFYPSPVRA